MLASRRRAHASLFALLLALPLLATAEPLRINAGGPSLPSIGWRASNGLLTSSSSKSYFTSKPVSATGTWAAVYQSHRWAISGDLVYKIPVKPGSYQLFLLWSETWLGSGVGKRVFTVKVNGASVTSSSIPDGILDVFKVAGGFHKPLFVNLGSIKDDAGSITITLGRIPGKNNPMISGIVLNTPGADALVGDHAGVNPTDPAPAPSPAAAPSPAPPSVPSLAPSSAPSPAPPSSGGTCPVATSVTGRLRSDMFVMNVGGKALPGIAWGADNTNYITEGDNGQSANVPAKVEVPGSTWGEVFQTHRYTLAASMTYKIPLPAGKYNVALLHAETYFKSAGKRVFDVFINDDKKETALDVFKAVGFSKPRYVKFSGISSKDGFITISLKKIVENPMLSGIFISGTGASSIAIGGPESGECTATGGEAPTTPETPTTPTPETPVTTPEIETDFEKEHFAHSVSGGPYVETDFSKNGKATVNLDGTNSHSHKQVGTETGRIVKYMWTWKDKTNPKAAADGLVTVIAGKTSQSFPLGVTDVSLRVEDQFSNVAEESTTVTVNSATVPGAYCYYYKPEDSKLAKLELPLDVKSAPKPLKASTVGDINFMSTASFNVPFANAAFVARCVFFIDVPADASIQYKVAHNGPVKIFHGSKLLASSASLAVNQVTTTAAKAYKKGLQPWQIHYLRPADVQGKLSFQFANAKVVSAEVVRHDAGTTLPVITELGKTSTAPQGGELINIFGTAFVNGVTVKFGTVEANTVETTAGAITARAPPGTGVVDITVSTEAGVSNGVKFTYSETDIPIKFIEQKVKTPAGLTYNIPQIAAITFGPDGRLYCGAVNSKVYALTVDNAMQVTKTCQKSMFEKYPRTVLGVAFNPKSSALKLYMSTSTIFWKDRKQFDTFSTGWTNGKVQSITMNGPTGCFNDDLTDVVTGLPVSNHDHAVNAITFLPNGKMLIAVGGFTNGGISIKGDNLGGIPSNPLAGSIVECPGTGGAIKYADIDNPLKSKVVGGGCKTYATGLRNSFSMQYTTTRRLYATDNGPNVGFGLFSTNCNGGSSASKNIPDKLFLVQPGKWHGHPNINRGECIFDGPGAVQPLINNLQSSTNGVHEYRANTFGGKIKGDMFIAKFAVNGNGRLSRAQLASDGNIKDNGFTNVFLANSGLAIAEGPRGEIVMSRVYQSHIIVAKPTYPLPSVTTLLSVLPNRGPAAGGATVLITGHNFGKSPTVSFGGKLCKDVKLIDEESFICVTPAGQSDKQVGVAVDGAVGTSISNGTDYWYF